MWCLESVQGKTLSRRFFDEYSFKQLRQEMRGQWQKCYGEASMSIYLFTETITNTTNTAINDLSPGQWVIVAYDGEHYPGEITQINLPNIEVSVMHKSG